MTRSRPAQRIDTAEVLSFRLKVPLRDLEALSRGPTGQELGLELTQEGLERLLQPADGESFLRFRLLGTEAVLTEVTVGMDAGGIFFERVLGMLMVRHHGDLHARLVWNDADRNAEGNEIRIQRGATTYPPLAQNVLSGPPALASTEDARGTSARPPPLPKARRSAAPSDHGPTPEEREILELLEQARSAWEEYQRLKASKSKK